MKSAFLALTFLALSAQAATGLRCQEGLEIDFGRPLTEIPAGRNPARFKGFSLLLQPVADVRYMATFRPGEVLKQQISVTTAYCRYSFLLKPVEPSAVLQALVECEGQVHALRCETRP